MARAIITAADCKETPIPQGLVAWWPGTYVSVPAGWEIADGQVSANDPTYTKPGLCDGRLPKLASTPGATGGSDTHNHTIPSHNHGGVSGPGNASINRSRQQMVLPVPCQTIRTPLAARVQRWTLRTALPPT